MEEPEVIHILIMNEMLDLYDEIRKLNRLRHLYDEAMSSTNNEVRKKMRSTKENWIEERCDSMKK